MELYAAGRPTISEHPKFFLKVHYDFEKISAKIRLRVWLS